MDSRPSANNNSSNSNGSSIATTTKSGSSVVVIGSNNNNLDELFSVVKDSPAHNLSSSSLRGRNLPESFWNPKPKANKSTPLHSRESSFDQLGSSNSSFSPNPGSPLSPNNNNNVNNNNPGSPLIGHQQQTRLSNHNLVQIVNQNNPASNSGSSNNSGSNQRINIITGVHGSIANSCPAPGLTSSSHSRAHSSPATLQQTAFSIAPNLPGLNSGLNPVGGLVNPSAASATVPSPLLGSLHGRQLSLNIDNLKLPDGWEMAVDKNTGKRYFIDHANKSTTWDDPRIMIYEESMRKTQLAQLAVQRQQEQLARLSVSNNSLTGNLPLPEGWEERITPQGEAYYVNHHDKTTTWTDPRIVIRTSHSSSTIITSQSPSSAAMLAAMAAANSNRPPPPGIGDNVRSITQTMSASQRVQQLNQERENMSKRRQEISQWKGHHGHQMPPLFGGTLEETLPATILGHLGGDPFLGSNNNNQDCHSRQESSDSGLGLGSYSLPRTPEGLLNSSDNLSSHAQQHQQQPIILQQQQQQIQVAGKMNVSSPSPSAMATGSGSICEEQFPIDSLSAMDLGQENVDMDFISELDNEFGDIENFLSPRSNNWI